MWNRSIFICGLKLLYPICIHHGSILFASLPLFFHSSSWNAGIVGNSAGMVGKVFGMVSQHTHSWPPHITTSNQTKILKIEAEKIYICQQSRLKFCLVQIFLVLSFFPPPFLSGCQIAKNVCMCMCMCVCVRSEP